MLLVFTTGHDNIEGRMRANKHAILPSRTIHYRTVVPVFNGDNGITKYIYSYVQNRNKEKLNNSEGAMSNSGVENLRRRRSVHVPETERERPLVVVLQVTALRFQPADRAQDHDCQVERHGDLERAPQQRGVVLYLLVEGRFRISFLRR